MNWTATSSFMRFRTNMRSVTRHPRKKTWHRSLLRATSLVDETCRGWCLIFDGISTALRQTENDDEAMEGLKRASLSYQRRSSDGDHQLVELLEQAGVFHRLLGLFPGRSDPDMQKSGASKSHQKNGSKEQQRKRQTFRMSMLRKVKRSKQQAEHALGFSPRSIVNQDRGSSPHARRAVIPYPSQNCWNSVTCETDRVKLEGKRKETITAGTVCEAFSISEEKKVIRTASSSFMFGTALHLLPINCSMCPSHSKPRKRSGNNNEIEVAIQTPEDPEQRCLQVHSCSTGHTEASCCTESFVDCTDTKRKSEPRNVGCANRATRRSTEFGRKGNRTVKVLVGTNPVLHGHINPDGNKAPRNFSRGRR